MFIPAIIIGLLGFLGAYSGWYRVKNQPEDIPMYSMVGHQRLSKKSVYLGVILLLLFSTFFLIGGLLIQS